MMPSYIQVTTTAATEADAQTIAATVVEKRLVACAQVVGPITSTYWWQGKIEAAEEWLCMIKSKEALYEKLERTILEIHPYEVPEILAVPITKGSESYLAWLDENTK
jgi:periplasmic divalent cation tolerance protein